MAWSYILTNADSMYTDNTSTTVNDYFSDWTRSFTDTGTGTTYSPYAQTYTVPYDILNIGRQESYYQIIRGPIHHSGQHSQEPVQQNIPQKSAEQIKEETEATERAKTLLLEYLDEDNKQKFYDKKHLEIPSKLFNDVKYHIPLSKLGRIKAWKENKVISELCLLIKDTEQLPAEDVVLTKLLYVLHDERNMLKIANHFNVKENLLAGLN